MEFLPQPKPEHRGTTGRHLRHRGGASLRLMVIDAKGPPPEFPLLHGQSTEERTHLPGGGESSMRSHGDCGVVRQALRSRI